MITEIAAKFEAVKLGYCVWFIFRLTHKLSFEC